MLSTFHDRLAVSDNATRSLLKTRSSKQKAHQKTDNQNKEKLRNELQEQYPQLSAAFEWTIANCTSESNPAIMSFFLCLSSNSPVCSYIPPTLHCKELLKSLSTSDAKSMPTLLRELQLTIPIVYDLFISIPANQLGEPWEDLFKWLHDVSCAPFHDINIIQGPALKSEMDPLSFFPTLPKLRERGFYEMDLNQKSKSDDPCTKRSHGHPSLTCGIFTIYCQHG